MAKQFSIWSASLVAAFLAVAPSLGQDNSTAIPHGKVDGPFQLESDVFPGTVRDYWVYVPAQYDRDGQSGQEGRPPCLMVVQDGLDRARGWRLPEALDRAIHRGDAPVTLGVFVDPGVVPAANDNAQPRFNRSYEYDSMTDRYARMLVDELLPEVAKRYRFSDDPNDRVVAGASSGGICAFNVAWRRPDEFRRVFCTIGTFVGLRGGDEFSTLVRKTEPKPIRVFLQDGRNDLNIYAGDWWAANQQMESALRWAGYDVHHAWGDGGHDSEHAAEVLPEALRWLWRDHPEPIAKPVRPTRRRFGLLIPDEPWELVSEGHGFTEGPAVNAAGEVFFTDLGSSTIHRIGIDGEVSLFAENTEKANGLMFGADGRLYACANGARQIVAYEADGSKEVVVDGVRSNDLVMAENGFYFTDPGDQRVHYVPYGGEPRLVHEGGGIEFPNGIALSPDHTQLYVVDMRGAAVHAFSVQQDGSLAHGEPLCHLHLAPETTETLADGLTVDTVGRLYVTSELGVQVCDPLGRVNLIISRPQEAWLANVVFGGPDLDVLYATCNDKVYRRKVNAKGFLPWSDPIKPPRPGL